MSRVTRRSFDTSFVVQIPWYISLPCVVALGFGVLYWGASRAPYYPSNLLRDSGLCRVTGGRRCMADGRRWNRSSWVGGLTFQGRAGDAFAGRSIGWGSLEIESPFQSVACSSEPKTQIND